MFNPAVVARKIQVDLMAAGFKVNLLSLPGDEFRTAVDSGKLAFYLDEVDADIADPSNFYDRLFLARERFLGDPDGDIQAAVRKASTTADSSSRKVYYDTANKLIYQKAAIVPIAHASNATIFRDIVDNVSVGPTAENFPDMSTLPGSMTFIQTFEPKSLNPGDEVNRDDMRIARLLYDTLVINEPGGTAIQPSLAESWSTNTEMTDWTFNLRYDVRFTDGKVLDANDVVATFDALWNASSINHEGRTGEFTLFKRLFGGFINAK
jgi:ABC-type transport system substrate-binding protein